jgi:gluconate 2-dehydrogenase gamma chain
MAREFLSRRDFLSRSGRFAGGAWLAFNWPLLESTAQAAVAARGRDAGFANLAPAQAAELEAIAAQVIPFDDTPGAREAGVIYFIDGALGSFAAGGKETVISGLADLHERVRVQHGEGLLYSGLTAPLQIEMLHGIEDTAFFGLVQYLTVAGMFSLPSYGGNRDKIGWKLIGFEDRHHWQPPFGWYDAQLAKGEGDG